MIPSYQIVTPEIHRGSNSISINMEGVFTEGVKSEQMLAFQV